MRHAKRIKLTEPDRGGFHHDGDGRWLELRLLKQTFDAILRDLSPNFGEVPRAGTPLRIERHCPLRRQPISNLEILIGVVKYQIGRLPDGRQPCVEFLVQPLQSLFQLTRVRPITVSVRGIDCR